MALAELPSVCAPDKGPKSLPNCEAAGSVVWLRGEHDISTLPGMWATVARAIAFDDGDVVVDLSAVDFMDASTISVLVRARTMLAKRSRSLTLRAPSGSALRVLGLCGVTNIA